MAAFLEMYAAALLALATRDVLERAYRWYAPHSAELHALSPTALDREYTRSESDDGHYANL